MRTYAYVLYLLSWFFVGLLLNFMPQCSCATVCQLLSDSCTTITQHASEGIIYYMPCLLQLFLLVFIFQYIDTTIMTHVPTYICSQCSSSWRIVLFAFKNLNVYGVVNMCMIFLITVIEANGVSKHVADYSTRDFIYEISLNEALLSFLNEFCVLIYNSDMMQLGIIISIQVCVFSNILHTKYYSSALVDPLSLNFHFMYLTCRVFIKNYLSMMT